MYVVQADMPRVVPDQRTKFETDELFKKLSQEMDVGIILLNGFYAWYI